MKIQLNIYDFSIFFDALSIIFSYSIFVSLIELLFSCSCFIYDLFVENSLTIGGGDPPNSLESDPLNSL